MVTLKKAGFTLVELLIVIGVIGILAAITIVVFTDVQKRASDTAITTGLSQAQKQLDLYQSSRGTFPLTGNLAAANIPNNDIDIQYTSNGSTYCITGTRNKVSLTINSETNSSVEGSCPGHGRNGVPPITNLVTNPSFETDLTGWTGTRTGTDSISRSQDVAHSGSWSVKLTSGAPRDWYLEGYVNNLPKGTWTVNAYIYLTSTNPTLNNRESLCCNPGGPAIASYDRTKLNQWQRVSSTYNFTYATSSLRMRFNAQSYATLYVDSVMVTQGSTVYPYADGTNPIWIWNGTAHNSTSTGPAL